MYKLVVFCALLTVASLSVSAQARSNDSISQQIRSLNIENSFTLSYDAGAGTSRLMAVSENFEDQQVRRVGLLAMNFAMGFFYPGSELKTSPDPVLLTFWVLTKRPRFAVSHTLKVITDTGDTLDLGDARYAAKPREDMEYLNFQISRQQLEKIVSGRNVRILLGTAEFSFTGAQMRTLRNFLSVSSL